MAKVLFWYVFSQVCLCSLVSVRKDSLLWRVSSHIGFMGFVVSQVSYFSRFCGFFRSFVVSQFPCVKGFVVTYVSCFHGFHGFNGFLGFVVSKVSWFYEFCGFVGFVVSQVSWVSCFHGSHLLLFIRTNIFFMLKINTCTCQTQVERTNFYVAPKKKKERKYSPQFQKKFAESGAQGSGLLTESLTKLFKLFCQKSAFITPKSMQKPSLFALCSQ